MNKDSGKTLRREGLNIGPGGWVLYRAADLGEQRLYVRLVEDGSGRLVVADVFMPFDEPPGVRTLRQVAERAARAEALANAEGTQESVRAWLDKEAPNPGAGLKDVRWAPRIRIKGDPRKVAGWLSEALTRPVVPTTRPYPDSFYVEIAEAYREIATWSHRPAAEIAEIADVPLNTVHGWVKEARKRGHLAPGRKGRAG